MNVGSLFSGIGGLDHGLARAGMRHVFFCESDPYRRDVLRARWPGVPVYDDVAEIDAQPDERGPRRIGGWNGSRDTVGLLAGGFPCQDVSVAGQRRGLAGARSGLFYEFARIVESLRPRWLLVENVPGLLSSNGGRDFGSVLGTLADLGYGLAWRVLDSRFFGVPQRRRRVFIVGARVDGDPRAAAERAGEVLAVGSRCDRHPPTGTKTGKGVAEPLVSGTLGGRKGFTGDDIDRGGAFIPVSYALNGKHGKRDDGESETFIAAPLSHGSNPNSNQAGRRREDGENLVATSITLASDPIHAENLAQPSTKRNGDPGVVQVGASVRRLMPVECERLQALPDGWTDLGATTDSKRYAALGDAVTSSVAEWIGRRMMAA